MKSTEYSPGTEQRSPGTHHEHRDLSSVVPVKMNREPTVGRTGRLLRIPRGTGFLGPRMPVKVTSPVVSLTLSRERSLMKTDTEVLASDMMRFASLLRHLNQSVIAIKCEFLARALQNEPSEEAVEEVRLWLRASMKGGGGSLSDLYVQKAGAVEEVLNAEYEELLQKFTDFVNAEPESNESAAAAMFANGSTYFRLIENPVRKGWFSFKGTFTYEVATAPGVTRLVTLDQLGDAVGYGPQSFRKDWQECKLVADRLFREGRRDDWVQYSSSYVFPDETLREHW